MPQDPPAAAPPPARKARRPASGSGPDTEHRLARIETELARIGAAGDAADRSARHAGRAVTAAWAGVVINGIIVAVALFTPMYPHRLDLDREARHVFLAKQVAVALGDSITREVSGAVTARKHHVQSWLKLIGNDVSPSDDSTMQRCVEHTDTLYSQATSDPAITLLLQDEGDLCKAAATYLKRSYHYAGSASPIASIEDNIIVLTDTSEANQILERARKLAHFVRANIRKDGTARPGPLIGAPIR